MMRRNPEETAVLLGILVRRSGHRRARVSEKTIRLLSKRRMLRTAFMGMVMQHAEDLGLTMIELDTGGWGVMPSKGLQGAPAVTARKYLAETLKELNRDPQRVLGAIRSELEQDNGTSDDEETS